MTVAVVTDSTASLPAEAAASAAVTVVPIDVVIGGEVRREGVDLDPAVLVAALRRHERVTTSRPTPAAFAAVYDEAAAAGADAVVSIHLSARMSGTIGSARLAAADARVPVTVVDSRSVGMGLGYAVLAAARRAAAGEPAAAVAAEATACAAATLVVFCVDDLDALRRGGRIGPAAARLGDLLGVKPLLTVSADGMIEPLERVRTRARAVARMAELAGAFAGADSVVEVAAHVAGGSAAEADALVAALQSLRSAGPDAGPGTVLVAPLSAAVTAHTGPGATGVVVHRVTGG